MVINITFYHLLYLNICIKLYNNFPSICVLKNGTVVFDVILDAVINVRNLLKEKFNISLVIGKFLKTFEISKTPVFGRKSFSSFPHLLAIRSQVSLWYRT